VTTHDKPTEQMIAEAARWLTLLHDEAAGDSDHEAFDAWCKADPRHDLAHKRMRALWSSLDELPAAPARVALMRSVC
jgi:transmembrane sensor